MNLHFQGLGLGVWDCQNCFCSLLKQGLLYKERIFPTKGANSLLILQTLCPEGTWHAVKQTGSHKLFPLAEMAKTSNGKLSPKEPIYMKCQILFSWEKIRKHISNCRLLKILPSMQSVNTFIPAYQHEYLCKQCGPYVTARNSPCH